MGEPRGFEEREGAVDLRGGRPPAFPVEAFHDLVGSHRTMFGKQELEHRAPVLREALPALAADRFGAGETLRDARAVGRAAAPETATIRLTSSYLTSRERATFRYRNVMMYHNIFPQTGAVGPRPRFEPR